MDNKSLARLLAEHTEGKQPFYLAKKLADIANCDIAVPNGLGRGIGDVLVYTPVIEEMARRLGRPVKMLTAPIQPKVGVVENEFKYPVWENNPYVSEILDLTNLNSEFITKLSAEKDDCCQFNHIIENICVAYGLPNRNTQPSIYLTLEEQTWALRKLDGIQRPLIAIHPSGKTSSLRASPWYESNWMSLIERCSDAAGFVQIGKADFDHKNLNITFPRTTLRQMFALIWACDGFVGFDSGPMHVAAAFNKPSAIIWDAERKLEAEERWQTGFSSAVLLRWGYSENRNLMILSQHQDQLLEQLERWTLELSNKLSWGSYSSTNSKLMS